MHYYGLVFINPDDATNTLEARSHARTMMDHTGGDGHRWDWFVIGGRWSGHLAGDEGADQYDSDGALCDVMRLKDLRELEDIGDRIVPAFVVMDSEWYAKEKFVYMGYLPNWDTDKNEMKYNFRTPSFYMKHPGWGWQVKGLLNRLPEDWWVVVIDAHN